LAHLFLGHVVQRAVVRTLTEMEERSGAPPSCEAAARAAARMGFVDASVSGPPFLADLAKRQFKERLRGEGISGAELAIYLSYARAWVEMDLVAFLAGPAAQGHFERRPPEKVLRDASSAGDAGTIRRLLAGWVAPRERAGVRAEMAGLAEALVRSRRGRTFVKIAATCLLACGEVDGDFAAELFEAVYGRPAPSWADWLPYWAERPLGRATVRSGWLPPPIPEHLPEAGMQGKRAARARRQEG
jgi:hypothetical protein